MDLFQAIILGLVEGISEFLPISSTGHLIILSELLGIKSSEFVKSFNIFIQSGAILAVLVLYSRDLLEKKDLIYKVFVAFLPTAVIGLIFYKFIKEYLLGSVEVTLWALFLGGIALILIELYFKKTKPEARSQELIALSFKKAFLIGLVQSISIIPGVSRSAASIIGGMFFGLNRVESVKFSFLLAIPTLSAATTLDLVSTRFEFSANEWGLLGVGFVMSFIVAVAVMKWLLSYVKNYTFMPFGIYRVVIAVLLFLFTFK